jgi:hypothetical protein
MKIQAVQQMTNSEVRMTKQIRMAIDELLCIQPFRHSEFVIVSSFWFRHSGLAL